MREKNNEIDMCSGPLLGKMIAFTIPLVLTVIMQQLFNTADLVVVGKFGHPGALAAVGATAAVTNLLVNFFNGLSIGAGVCIARHYGAKSYDSANTCVHTAVTISLIGGVVIGIFAVIMAKPILELVSTPPEVIDNAMLYMRIYFAGMPLIMLFNFCASMLRAVGDSKRTLIYISTAGVINVVLNLFFVIVLDLNVAGVAIATVISQIYSALMSLRCFVKYDGCLKLNLKKLRIDKTQLKFICSLGVPSGIQASLFSISNTLIQASINSFGTAAISGNTAAGNIEGYIYVLMNSVSNTTTNFTGQNYGANRFDRIRKIMWQCCIMTTVIGVVTSAAAIAFGKGLLGLYTNSAQEIEFGLVRMSVVVTTYFLCGVMEVFMGLLRGTCHPVSSMMISLIGSCLFRVVWVMTVFRNFHTLEVLYMSYPISWALTIAALAVCFVIFLKRHEAGKVEAGSACLLPFRIWGKSEPRSAVAIFVLPTV